MIVPRTRLILWVSLIVLPFAALAGTMPSTLGVCAVAMRADSRTATARRNVHLALRHSASVFPADVATALTALSPSVAQRSATSRTAAAACVPVP